MYKELNQVGFPELMTETEVMHFLRIPAVSHGANPHHVVENLKRFHQLPCIHISRKPLYPLVALRRRVEEKLTKEQSVWFRIRIPGYRCYHGLRTGLAS